MFRVTSKNRLNISHKRTAMGQTLAVLVLCFVLVPLLHESWVSQSSMFFAERMELPVHAPARTIVSISTFSQRVFNMRFCLDSVFAQSQLPDRIIISIPRKFRVLEPTTGAREDYTATTRHNETELDMVDWFHNYTRIPYVFHVNYDVQKTSYVYDMGILTVQFLDDDPWGPATKLIGALLLEKDPETVIITLDDDLAYHRDTVKWLATHMQPGIALSFGCEMWRHDRSEFIDWTIGDFFYMTTPRVCAGWLCGWTGVGYHVSSFRSDIYTFIQALPAGCFNNDDMWLSGYLVRQGVPRMYAPNVLKHGRNYKNVELSLSAIVNYREKGYSCGRYLFP
jgi:hypothetical protein